MTKLLGAIVFLAVVPPASDVPHAHPLNNQAEIESEYGPRMHPVLHQRQMHRGVDFRVDKGTPVYATAAGFVKVVAEDDKYGKFIVVDHGEGYTTLYAHLEKQLAAEGAEIASGAQIGTTGNSGLSRKPHLHYEVRLHDESQDPEAYLPK